MLFPCPLEFVWSAVTLKSHQCAQGQLKANPTLTPSGGDFVQLRIVLFVIPVFKSHHPQSAGLVHTLQQCLASLNLPCDRQGSTFVSYACHIVKMRSMHVLLCLVNSSSVVCHDYMKTHNSLPQVGPKPKGFLGNKSKPEVFTWFGFENLAIQQF